MNGATTDTGKESHARVLDWVDAHLLASALVQPCSLWTADASLAALAAELRVADTPTR